jgi:hypothetical protein
MEAVQSPYILSFILFVKPFSCPRWAESGSEVLIGKIGLQGFATI